MTPQMKADILLQEYQTNRKHRQVNTGNYKGKLRKWRTELLLLVQHIDDALARIEGGKS